MSIAGGNALCEVGKGLINIMYSPYLLVGGRSINGESSGSNVVAQ